MPSLPGVGPAPAPAPHRVIGSVGATEFRDGPELIKGDVIRDPVLGSGTDQILAAAAENKWTVIDVAADWSAVYPPPP